MAVALVGAAGIIVVGPAVAATVEEQLEEMRRMIQRQNEVIERLERQLEERDREAAPVPAAREEAPAKEGEPRPAVAAAPPPAPEKKDGGASMGDFVATYDKGFAIKPKDPEKTPFGLRINGRTQFRYTFFTREDRTYETRTGVEEISNRNDFEIERARLEFRTFFLDPKLQAYVNLDMDTDDNHDVIAHDYWLTYAFHPAFELFGGKGMVPGSRDWLNGSTRTRFVDRSLATTFFRPDRTIGLWAKGQPLPGWYYHVLVGNGFSTSDLKPDQIDNNFAYSGTTWWDLGDYGDGYSDLESHETPASRLGTSFTFAKQQGKVNGIPRGESNFLRLSDGTRVTAKGALGPGVTIDREKGYLWALDGALKWRGFSINSEYFFRWLFDLEGDGPLITDDVFDHGFYVETGYFLIPHHLELNARTSQIFGDFGDRSEYAAGVNWFIKGTHGLKLSLDGTYLDGSPADNSGTNYRLGARGVMVRTQLQAAF